MAIPVQLRGLTKSFGDTVAVDQVDLDIPAGDLFFLLGPSGCGKTTLLRMLAGFIDPTAGTIRFGGLDVSAVPSHQRNTGMVFQSYALWPHMTVAQNVAFGLQVRKRPRAEIDRRVGEALAAVQMTAYEARKPNELSGGQQQRVALARALVIKPDLLLLDEPLSNLDAKLRLEMRGTIRRVCKEAGLTAVYVTHDQKEALSMADAMAVLQAGRVVQVGAPRTLYDRPRNRFVADFLGEANFIPAVVLGRVGEELMLDGPAGPLRSRTFPEGLSAGQRAICMVRPEAITLSHDPRAVDATGAPLNRLTARRVNSVYLGETAQHQLVAGSDLSLKAFELNPRPIEPAAPAASTVTLGFHARDLVVLTD
jgi:iron(III) transport system ATP-binding protein